MSAPYLKADLVTELAKSVGLSKRKTDLLLNLLAQIAYREARTGFTVPGICRLDVVHRNARRARIPRTGEQIIIGAHDSLRVRPLRKAKHAVTPMMPGLVQLVPAEVATESPAAEEAPSNQPLEQEKVPAPAPESVAPDAAAPQQTQPTLATLDALPANNEGLVSFRCVSCGQEIEAPFDMAGTASECPTCGSTIEVPYISEPGTIWGRTMPDTKQASLPANVPQSETPPESHEAMKGRTIRIELPDDI